METVVIPDLVTERREQVRAFMDEHIYPNETALIAENERADALIAKLQQEAKDAGLWAPHLPPEAGGTGSGFIEYAYLNEEIGRSFIAQLIFGCQAPDAGNGEILHLTYTKIPEVPTAYGIGVDKEGTVWFSQMTKEGTIGKVDPQDAQGDQVHPAVPRPHTPHADL